MILMGVAGSGKTTVGRALAARLGWAFYDGDAFHPEANVEKMAGGAPLDDADRRPWLEALHGLIAARLAAGESLVLACSALKRSYRATLRRGHEASVTLVHLRGAPELILERMRERRGHYMKAEMLASQLTDLEAPEDALVLDVDRPPEALVDELVRALRRGGPGGGAGRPGT